MIRPSIQFSFFLLLLLTTAATATQIGVLGRCPDICRADISQTFAECRSEFSRGCTMVFCGSPSSQQTSCRLRSSGPASISPTESVILDDINTSSPATRLPLSFDDDATKATTKLDVYLLVDATASMGAVIISIQNSFNRVLRTVSSKFDAAFGVGIFRDERELTSGFESFQHITKDLPAVLGGIGMLEASGGLDASEANLVALHKVATNLTGIRWREGSRRIIIYVADNPGHEPTCRNGKVWHNRGSVLNNLKSNNISVVAVSYPLAALDRKPSAFECASSVTVAGPGQASFLSEGSGGILIGGNGAVFNANKVASVIGTLSSKVTVARNSCSKVADVGFQPNLPVVLTKGQVLSVLIGVNKSICGLKFPYNCEIEFQKSGISVPPFRVTINKPVDC